MLRINSRYGVLEALEREDLVSNSLKMYGEWAQNEVAFLESLVSGGDTVVDVGAYVGSHSLAFARVVGSRGRVVSVEPNPTAVQALTACRDANDLVQLIVVPTALGDVESDATAIEAFTDLSNMASGRVRRRPPIGDTATPFVPVRTLDSLHLESCKLIKIDVEGSEASVLLGGLQTLVRCRPFVSCECNTITDSLAVLALARQLGFSVHGYVFAAFNPANFFGNTVDMFNGNCEATLLLSPLEHEALAQQACSKFDGQLIKTPDDIALLLRRKPQYPADVNANLEEETTWPVLTTRSLAGCGSQRLSGAGNDARSTRSALSRTDSPVVLVVPFYRQSHLVLRVFECLVGLRDELRRESVSVVFINDSPEDQNLGDALAKCEARGKELEVCFEVWTNPENQGFVKTANRGLRRCNELKADALLLNSDTQMFPGTISELRAVARTEAHIGFVSPRSNNATICNLPHFSEGAERDPDHSRSRWNELQRTLPRYSFVPTVVGFCMYIKRQIIAEFGVFDEAYGKGYNEENDLVCRANRAGYRAVLANWAFVWHEGEASFGASEATKALLEGPNSELLSSRYPEYQSEIEAYFSSPRHRAEQLLEGLLRDEFGRQAVAWDFSQFGSYHAGTFEAGKQLLRAVLRVWPNGYTHHVIIGEGAWEFHELSALGVSGPIHPLDVERKFAAVIRIGQVFSFEQLCGLVYRSPIIAVFMLDPIPADTMHLRRGLDEDLWRFLFLWGDLVFTISTFGATQFLRRYRCGPRTDVVAVPLSIEPKDYGDPGGCAPSRAAQQVGQIAVEPDYILVIGNAFLHKWVAPTVHRLSREFPGLRFVALGMELPGLSNVLSVAVGALTDEEISAAYCGAALVVFPSHYEGFGFPLLHAIARQKPVVVRKLPVFEEIVSHLPVGTENVHWFETVDDIVALLASGAPRWVGVAAEGDGSNWDTCARQVLEHIQRRVGICEVEDVEERVRWLEKSFLGKASADSTAAFSQSARAARFVSQFIERALTRLLNRRYAYATGRFVWRGIRRLRSYT